MSYPTSGEPADPYQQPGQQPPPPYDPTAPYTPDPGAQTSGQPPGHPPAGYGPPPGYIQPQYGQPSYGQPTYVPVVATTNTMAILALVFAFVFAPAAIVLGHVAKKQIQQTGEQGGGLATAGLVLGYIITGFYALGCLGFVLLSLVIPMSTSP